MNRTTIATMSFGCLMLASGTADAFHLGDLRVVSRTGEPLKAYVQLWSDGSAARGPVTATIVPDGNYASNAGLSRLGADLQARYVTDSVGAGYVEITGRTPYTESLLAIRLRVAQGSAARIRHYAASLAPPAATIAGRSRGTLRAQPRPLAGAVTYRVAPGDTLWKIARAVGGAPETVMQSIVAANPQAFVNGDRDQLIAGAELRLPGAAPASVEPTQPVRATQVSPVTAPVQDATPPTTAAAATQPTAPLPVAEVDWRERYPETAAEIARLSEKFDAIRARYGLAASAADTTVAVEIPASLPATPVPVADAQEALAPPAAADDSSSESLPAVSASEAADQVVEIGETVADEIAMETTGATAPAVEAPVSETAAAAAVAMKAPMQSTDTSTWLRPRTLVPVAVIAASILVLVFTAAPLLRRLRSRKAEVHHKVAEENRKAAISRKAEHRVKLESEVRKMIDDRTAGDRKKWEDHVLDITGEHDRGELAAFEPQSTTIERAGGDDGYDAGGETLDLSRETLDLSRETLDLSRETQDLRELLAMQNDISVEIVGEFDVDNAIAHGRYEEAEARLQEVIAANPKNYDARLRLAEVFYITERIEDFVALAEVLYNDHRDEMNDGEWQRVMRMGKIIAPDQPPFCGPRSVTGSKVDTVS